MRRLSANLGPARRVVAPAPETKKKKKKGPKPLPEWSFSVSDLDAMKTSKDEQERRKASMVSKHAEQAKEAVEDKLIRASRNPRASLKALEKLAPEEDPTRLKSPAAKFTRAVTSRDLDAEKKAALVDQERLPSMSADGKLLDVTELLDAFRQSLAPEEAAEEACAAPTFSVVQPAVTTKPKAPFLKKKPAGFDEVSLAAIDVQKMLSELELQKDYLPGAETEDPRPVPALTALEQTTTALEQNMQRLEAQVVMPQMLDASSQCEHDEALREAAATKIQAVARGASTRRAVDALADSRPAAAQPQALADLSRLPLSVAVAPDLATRYDALESRVLVLAKQQIAFQQEVVTMHAVLADQVDTLRSQLLEGLATIPAAVANGAVPPPQVSGQGLPLYSSATPTVSAEVETTEQFLRAEHEARGQAVAAARATADAEAAQSSKQAALTRERAEQQAMRDRREEEALLSAQREERDALQLQLDLLKQQKVAQQEDTKRVADSPAVVVVTTGGASTQLASEVYRTPPRAVRETPRAPASSSSSSGDISRPPQPLSSTAVTDLASQILMDRATPPASPVAVTPSPPKDTSGLRQNAATGKKLAYAPMPHVKVIDVLAQNTSTTLDCPMPRMEMPAPSAMPQAAAGSLTGTPTRVRAFGKGGDGEIQLSAGKFMAAMEAAAD